MAQIGLLLVSAGLMFAGVQALRGKEKPENKTPKGVAIATLVIAVAIAVFALAFLPRLLAF